MPSPLFSGATSLRYPRERAAFVLTLLFALPIAYAIGLVIHERIGPPEVALFLVIAMLYVTLARGRLIGSSVMIHEAQYPRVFTIVKRICASLDLPMPLIFVREDNQVPAVALGFGEPYALVVSSHWVEHFKDDELAFVIGCELGHIASGHTRFLSLLSVNGNENPIVSLVFGGWLRTCTMTCDRIGLLACGSLESATRAIAMSSFHSFGRHVDVRQFAEQGREIASDGVLRLGEWLGGEPYATRRIAAMQDFMLSPAYASAKAWFERNVPEPPVFALPRETHVEKADCAGFWRRAAALMIDVTVVGFLVLAFQFHNTENVVSVNGAPAAQSQPAHARSDDDDTAQIGPVRIDDNGVHFDGRDTPVGHAISALAKYFGNLTWLTLTVYFILLTGFAGQTFGMMITGLRVVQTDFRPAGIWRSLVRYLIVFFLWWIVVALAPFTRRVMLHDRFSGTRLIRAERLMARAVTVRYSAG